MTTLLQGRGDVIEIEPGSPVRVIGERINPSGRRRLHQALTVGDWEYLRKEAIRQVEAGADFIDVNVGGKGIEEVSTLPQAVKAISEVVHVPLVIDTRNPSALQAALEICPGRPLVNSISGERKALTELLPIVLERKLPVIALCMGQEGIPNNADGRIKVATQILEAVVRSGMSEGDVIFDPLVLTVGADDQAARIALETTKRLREEFPHNNITGGASNISFGMPERAMLNAFFLVPALILGMNVPITDPTNPQIRMALMIANILLGRDKHTKGFLRYVRQERFVPNQ